MPLLIEKVFIGLDPVRHSIYALRGKILGPQGTYLKHIQTQTNCRVNLRGAGSGYVDLGAKEEPQEPLHLQISGTKPEEIATAKQLAEDLLEHVRREAEAAAQMPPTMPPGYPSAYPMMMVRLSGLACLSNCD